MEDNKVFVTQPFLPPLEEFIPYLEQIWSNKILTNNGPFHKQLESELAAYLGVRYVSLFANGTLALITALQALRVAGEVITTPFSFVATTHSLLWNNIKPVFVDIEPDYFNIDPQKIEAAITPKTTAILPVHVYGNPCNLKRIKEIADNYGLKIIYDAAHAFGVRSNGESILNFGDLSVLSFHATKVYNTFEGGAVVCHDIGTKKRIDYLKNFGFSGETTIVSPGINAKMSEIQAAMGLLQLKHIEESILKRKTIAEIYRDGLQNTPGVTCMASDPNVEYNYSYFPVFIEESEFGISRNQLYEKLQEFNIYGRRYFYPLISQFSMYQSLSSAKPDNLVIASKIAEQVICLPIYPTLTTDKVWKIVEIINKKGV